MVKVGRVPHTERHCSEFIVMPPIERSEIPDQVVAHLLDHLERSFPGYSFKMSPQPLPGAGGAHHGYYAIPIVGGRGNAPDEMVMFKYPPDELVHAIQHELRMFDSTNAGARLN